MKKIFFSLCLFAALGAAAQDAEVKPAAKGVVYGDATVSEGTTTNVNDLQSKMAGAAFEGKVQGRVKEVCKAMGCWIRLEKADGTTLMVKSKDHAFTVPQDLIGHTVVVDGTASVKEVSEEKRRHFAEDAGKSKAEIKKIKGSEKEVQFVARSIQVVD